MVEVPQQRMAWCQLGLWSGFGSILLSVCNCICALKLEKNTLFISVSDFSALVAITVTSCFGSLLLLCCSDCHSGCLDAVALALAFASQHLVFLFLF